MHQIAPQDHMLDCIDRMERLLAQAFAVLRSGNAQRLSELKPLRLKMAGAITSFQVALDRVSTEVDMSPAQAAAAKAASTAWQNLGNDFRAFTLLNQSSSPQAWVEYRASADQFMQRIAEQIRSGRALLVDDAGKVSRSSDRQVGFQP